MNIYTFIVHRFYLSALKIRLAIENILELWIKHIVLYIIILFFQQLPLLIQTNKSRF